MKGEETRRYARNDGGVMEMKQERIGKKDTGKERKQREERKQEENTGNKEMKRHCKRGEGEKVVANGEARGTGGETDGDVTKGREGTKRRERKRGERHERNVTSQIFCSTSTALHFG